MWTFTYKCNRCHRLVSESKGLGHYRLPDGMEIPQFDEAAWCFECDGLQSAEQLLDIEYIGEVIQHLEEHGLDQQSRDIAHLLEKDEDSSHLERLWTWRAMLEWRRTRQSPPRCLRCGSTKLRMLRSPDSRFLHPGCGGVFSVISFFHSTPPTFRLLDPEGRSLT